MTEGIGIHRLMKEQRLSGLKQRLLAGSGDLGADGRINAIAPDGRSIDTDYGTLMRVMADKYRVREEPGSVVLEPLHAADRGQVPRLQVEVEVGSDAAETLPELIRVRAAAAAAAFKEWIGKPFKLERPSASVAHKAITASGKNFADTGEQLHSFLIEHDWAALLGEAAVTGMASAEEWRMPYDHQVFEFKISGANVMAFVNGGSPASAALVVRPPGGRWVVDQINYIFEPHGYRVLTGQSLIDAGRPEVNKRLNDLVALVYAQVRAVLVMLEAKVATTEPTRAPYKSNQPPSECGPLPAISHYVVKVRRPDRPAVLPAKWHQQGRRRRLHFRRGHWRHFVAHRTWIEWTLVGDPDLGFVDKEYRL
jgi:hypothetical protein